MGHPLTEAVGLLPAVIELRGITFGYREPSLLELREYWRGLGAAAEASDPQAATAAAMTRLLTACLLTWTPPPGSTDDAGVPITTAGFTAQNIAAIVAGSRQVLLPLLASIVSVGEKKAETPTPES